MKKKISLTAELNAECAYGENAPQAPAGLYARATDDPLALPNFELIDGSAPSFNNWCDVDRLLQTVTHIASAWDVNRESVPAIAVAAKHGNPCGAAVAETLSPAVTKALEGDLRAVFGGLVIITRPVDKETAELLLHHKVDGGPRRLLDGIIAPSFSDDAIAILGRKGGKCRLLANPALEKLSKNSLDQQERLRYVRGGFLAQPNYTFILDLADPELMKAGEKLGVQQEDDLLLAWAIGATSNSNTVTLVKDGMLIGNGVGQQDRVGCCKLALMRADDAGHDVANACAFSDSFFPFPDGPQVLVNAGIRAVLATHGSVQDDAVRAVFEQSNRTLYSLSDKVARGFYAH